MFCGIYIFIVYRICAYHMDGMYADVFLLGISLCDDAGGGYPRYRKSHCICGCFFLYLYGAPAGAGNCRDGDTDGHVSAAS